MVVRMVMPMGGRVKWVRLSEVSEVGLCRGAD